MTEEEFLDEKAEIRVTDFFDWRATLREAEKTLELAASFMSIMAILLDRVQGTGNTRFSPTQCSVMVEDLRKRVDKQQEVLDELAMSWYHKVDAIGKDLGIPDSWEIINDDRQERGEKHDN